MGVSGPARPSSTTTRSSTSAGSRRRTSGHQRPRQQPGREARFRAGRGGRAQRVRVWSGAHGPDARHDRRSRPDLLLARRRGRVARQGRAQAKSSTTDARQGRAARRHRVGESACTPSGLGVCPWERGLVRTQPPCGSADSYSARAREQTSLASIADLPSSVGGRQTSLALRHTSFAIRQKMCHGLRVSWSPS